MALSEIWAAAGTPNAVFRLTPADLVALTQERSRRSRAPDITSHGGDNGRGKGGTDPGRRRRLELAPWRGAFYPKGVAQARELEYAASHLTSIEIDSTYYGSKTPESFRKWRDATPDDFVFSVKGPRFATNRRVLAEAAPSIERFFKSGVTELKGKLQGRSPGSSPRPSASSRTISPLSSTFCRNRSTGVRSATRWRCATRASARRISLRSRASAASASSSPPTANIRRSPT